MLAFAAKAAVKRVLAVISGRRRHINPLGLWPVKHERAALYLH
jgi:hypothetical protein